MKHVIEWKMIEGQSRPVCTQCFKLITPKEIRSICVPKKVQTQMTLKKQ